MVAWPKLENRRWYSLKVRFSNVELGDNLVLAGKLQDGHVNMHIWDTPLWRQNAAILNVRLVGQGRRKHLCVEATCLQRPRSVNNNPAARMRVEVSDYAAVEIASIRGKESDSRSVILYDVQRYPTLAEALQTSEARHGCSEPPNDRRFPGLPHEPGLSIKGYLTTTLGLYPADAEEVAIKFWHVSQRHSGFSNSVAIREAISQTIRQHPAWTNRNPTRSYTTQSTANAEGAGSRSQHADPRQLGRERRRNACLPSQDQC